MITDIQAIILLIATILGAITTAGLGWSDSGANFDKRKFIPSLIRGIITAVGVFIVTYAAYTGEVTLFVYVGAYLAGGFFDVVGNRASGIYQQATT